MHLFRSDRRQLDFIEGDVMLSSSKIAADVQSSRGGINRSTAGEILTRDEQVAAVHGEAVGM